MGDIEVVTQPNGESAGGAVASPEAPGSKNTGTDTSSTPELTLNTTATTTSSAPDLTLNTTSRPGQETATTSVTIGESALNELDSSTLTTARDERASYAAVSPDTINIAIAQRQQDELLTGLRDQLGEMARAQVNGLDSRTDQERSQDLNQALLMLRARHNLSPNQLTDLRNSYNQSRAEAITSRQERVLEQQAAAFDRIDTMVKDQATEKYEPGKTEARIRADLETLRQEHGEGLSSQEWRRIVDQYMERRTDVRRKAMLSSVQKIARRQAEMQFDKDPSSPQNEATAAHHLESLAARYGDVMATEPQLEKTMGSLYARTYNMRHENLFNTELNWAQKKYYAAKGGLRKMGESIDGFVKRAKEIGSNVATAVGKAYDFVTDPENIQKAVDMTVSAVKYIADPRNLVKAGVAVVDFVRDPENQKAAWELAKKAYYGAGEVINYVIENPGEAWNKTKGFLKSVCDSVGLSDLAVGLKRLSNVPLGTLKALVGLKPWSEVGDDLMGGVQALKGAVRTVGELTGITDCIMCAKYALEGNWTMAGMHGAFALMSIGSIAATVATAGAAGGSILAVAAGRATFKEAAKQTFKAAVKNVTKEAAQTLGREITQEVVEQVGKETLEQTLKEGAQEIAETGARELAEIVTREGSEALTNEAAQEVMKNTSEEVVERMLKEMNVTEIVSDKVYKFLREMDGKSAKDIAKQLSDLGMDPKQAKGLAKEFRKALTKGNADDVMKEALEEIIQKDLRELVEQNMEATFRETFERALRNDEVLSKAIKENAERLGKSVDDVIDDLVESGWKGCREGIEKAVRKVVREGIEQAFKRFRKRGNLDSDLPDEEPIKVKAVERREVASVEDEVALFEGPGEMEREENGPQVDGVEKFRVRAVTDPDGQISLIRESYNIDTGTWQQLSSQVVKSAKSDAAA